MLANNSPELAIDAEGAASNAMVIENQITLLGGSDN
jgi:hypothetical protein